MIAINIHKVNKSNNHHNYDIHDNDNNNNNSGRRPTSKGTSPVGEAEEIHVVLLVLHSRGLGIRVFRLRTSGSGLRGSGKKHSI